MCVRPVPTLLATLLLACQPPEAGDSAATKALDENPVVARIGDQTVTLSALDAWIKDELFRRATSDGNPLKLYEARSEALRRLVDSRLLDAEATARGMSLEDLLLQEVEGKASVDDAAVKKYFEEHDDEFGGREFASVAPRIKTHLARLAGAEVARVFLLSLRKVADVTLELETPRVDVAALGPSLGPDDAPVTIVEFSDYQCPYCKRAEPMIKKLLETYPETVRFVFRHYPLDRIHPKARAASEAAACADEQKLFWGYHAALFEGAPAMESADLERYAVATGLDLDGFRTCVAERRTKARVEQDARDAQAAGVTGTPAFFVNGIPLSGVHPMEAFQSLIETELARVADGS